MAEETPFVPAARTANGLCQATAITPLQRTFHEQIKPRRSGPIIPEQVFSNIDIGQATDTLDQINPEEHNNAGPEQVFCNAIESRQVANVQNPPKDEEDDTFFPEQHSSFALGTQQASVGLRQVVKHDEALAAVPELIEQVLIPVRTNRIGISVKLEEEDPIIHGQVITSAGTQQENGPLYQVKHEVDHPVVTEDLNVVETKEFFSANFSVNHEVDEPRAALQDSYDQVKPEGVHLEQESSINSAEQANDVYYNQNIVKEEVPGHLSEHNSTFIEIQQTQALDESLVIDENGPVVPKREATTAGIEQWEKSSSSIVSQDQMQTFVPSIQLLDIATGRS